MSLPLTSRHEVVPALDAGSSDGSSRGQCHGHGESCLEGLGRGPSSLLPLVLLRDGQDERGWKGGGQGKGARARLRVKGRAARDQQILAGRGGRGSK